MSTLRRRVASDLLSIAEVAAKTAAGWPVRGQGARVVEAPRAAVEEAAAILRDAASEVDPKAAVPA